MMKWDEGRSGLDDDDDDDDFYCLFSDLCV